MAKRRRYDTAELVTEIQRERRAAIILSLSGVGILLLLILVYLAVMSGDEVQAVPSSEMLTDTVPMHGGAAGTDPTGISAPDPGEVPGEPEEPEEPEEPDVPEVAPSKVRLILTKKGQVWVDGKSLGRLKSSSIELTPGEDHEIKAKFGRKVVIQKLNPKPGQNYDLRIDARRKKAKLRKSKRG